MGTNGCKRYLTVSDEDRISIHMLRLQGVTLDLISRKLNVPMATVISVANGISFTREEYLVRHGVIP